MEKHGKGFSYGEIRAAGLTVADATRHSMPIDKRPAEHASDQYRKRIGRSIDA